MADLDSQSRADPARVQEVLGHRRATLVYLLDPEGEYESDRVAVARGNTAALCQHDTVLLVRASDAAGRLYGPGNHVGSEATWPLTVHVLAWAPRPITDLRLTASAGVICSATPNATIFDLTWTLESPAALLGRRARADGPPPAVAVDPAPAWFRVECYGNERFWGVAATTNPILVFPRSPRLADAASTREPTSIYGHACPR